MDYTDLLEQRGVAADFVPVDALADYEGAALDAGLRMTNEDDDYDERYGFGF